MSVPFRERNPVIIGAVSLAVIAAFMLAAFRAEDLPLIGGGDTYYAAFSEAGGLKANDEVRVAGVRVGKVDAGRARRATTSGSTSGSTTASQFGDADRRRDQGQDPARRDVPRARARRPRPARRRTPRSRVSRTTSPYDVVQAFSGLAGPLASRSTPTSWPSRWTRWRDLTKNTPEEFQARAAAASPTCPRTSPPATSSSTRCYATPSRSRRSSATAAATSSS